MDVEVCVGWNVGFDLRVGDGIFFLNFGVYYYSYIVCFLKENEIDNFEDIKLKDEIII